MRLQGENHFNRMEFAQIAETLEHNLRQQVKALTGGIFKRFSLFHKLYVENEISTAESL